MGKKLVIRRGVDAKRLSEARKFGTCIEGRYAGDGITSLPKGGGMVLARCGWCGEAYNFRRSGHRICGPCWDGRHQPQKAG